MKVIYNEETQAKPIKCWCENPEEGALKQAYNLSNLPFIHKHVALMPDVHQGYGMPIGGVIACEGVIIPQAVGVDISCGVSAVKTSLTVEDFDESSLKKVMGEIRKEIPVGFNKHSKRQALEIETSLELVPKICMQEWSNSMKSLGTLGGGKLIASSPRV